MNRFNIVNNMMQKNDDDDDDEVDKMGDDEPEQEELSDSTSSADYNAVNVQFDLPAEENLDKKSLDNEYWKVQVCEDDLDDLLADLE